MTIFRRSGHLRTSVLGNQHWVEDHYVARDTWESASPPQRDELALRAVRAHIGETARIVNPNAACPVCGQPVFFYQNEHGSRVFFDELGPPWPKHPCMSSSYTGEDSKKSSTPNFADLRSQEEFDSIQGWLGRERDDAFVSQYGTPRWDIAVFVTMYAAEESTFIVISTANGLRYLFLQNEERPTLVEGQLVTYYRGRLSYISPVDLQPVEIRPERVGAKRVLHHILRIESLAVTNDDD
jgi:hypothetical protein